MITPDSKPGSSETTIEDLPNEVLLLIFKELEWSDLLHKTSLVCRRWGDISMHYSLWMNKRICSQNVIYLEKILTTAPVLEELNLKYVEITQSTLEVLLKSTTTIRKLDIRVNRIEGKSRHLLGPVLRHFSANLECLELDGLITDLRWSEEECILGFMPKLRSLSLQGCLPLTVDINRLMPYSPVLEKLDLQGIAGLQNFIGDVNFDAAPKCIIRNSETLKKLHIRERVDLCSVAQCRLLSMISVPIQYVQVVSHLPNIESLAIVCTPTSFSIRPGMWCRPKNLKELILRFLPWYSHDCLPFLRAIRPPALTLYTKNFGEELAELLSPQIKRLTLHERSRIDCLRYLAVLLTNKLLIPNLEDLCVSHCLRARKRTRGGISADLRKAFPLITIHSILLRPYWYFP